MEKVKGFNDKIAVVIANATGNMWFFWTALTFCVILRVMYPPKLNQLLLNLENDLQLLLLAVNAVVGASLYANQMKQMDAQKQILENQDGILVKIEGILGHIEDSEKQIEQKQEQEEQV
ncbi:MAG: hypothetical protein ABFE07_16540, partial [Armatimonadia bacterium]